MAVQRARPVPAKGNGVAPTPTPAGELFDVTIQGKHYTLDPEADARFNTDLQGLNDALARNPSLFARYAALEVRARHNAVDGVEAAENELKRLHAELYAQVEALARDSGQKATVDSLKSAVLTNDLYQQALARYQRAVYTAELLLAGKQAMNVRLQAVVELARNMRAEWDAQTARP